MIKSDTKQSELTAITKAKDLCCYVMTITQKSPKHFRYMFVNRSRGDTEYGVPEKKLP